MESLTIVESRGFLKAKISNFQVVWVYLLPFAALVLIRLAGKNKSAAIFEEVNKWIHRVTEKYLPWILIIFGTLLLEDAVSYLLGYREYSFLSIIQ